MNNKPLVFNYDNYEKAKATIIELTGDIIQLNLDLQHYRDRDNAEKMEVKKLIDNDIYVCPHCDNFIAYVDGYETIRHMKPNAFTFCEYCGQRLEK